MTRSHRPAFLSKATLALSVAAVVSNAFVVAIAWRSLETERRHDVEAAARTTKNLTQVLEAALDTSIKQIDMALLSAKEEVEHELAGGDFRKEELEPFIGRLHSRIPAADSIRVADATGRVRFGVGVPRGSKVNVADRDYFLRVRDESPDGMAISAPLISRISGAWSIVFARRANRPDGSFGGVVYANVRLEQFTRTLARVDVGSDGAVVLRGADMEMIARYPPRPEVGRSVGEKAASRRLVDAVAAGITELSYTGRSPFDGVERFVTYRRVADYPLHLIVALSYEEFLAKWRADALKTWSLAALFGILTLLSSLLIGRYWRRESEASFRKLVEGAPVAVAVGMGSRLTYVNAAFVRAFGLSDAGAMAGRSLAGLVAPVDRGAFEASQAAASGHLPAGETAVEYTLQREDGSTFGGSVATAVVELAGSRATVAFIQDVTERQRAEAERERLIGELRTALADVKTLSGLIPICSHCKKIRDDQGFWNRIESYLRDRSDAEFTHGICPDCADRYFPPGT